MLSLLFNLSAIANLYVACRMLGEAVSLAAMAIAVPLILLVALLPITPGGYGVVQWAYMEAFGAVGLSYTIGVTASLLVSVKQILWAAGGFGVHSLTERAARPATPVALSEHAVRTP